MAPSRPDIPPEPAFLAAIALLTWSLNALYDFAKEPEPTFTVASMLTFIIVVLAGVTAIIVMFKLRTRYGVALEELRAEVNALRKELATLRAELRNLNLALAELLEAARRGEQR